MSSSDIYDVVVIGGGVAAGACVSTLRDEGFTGSIALVCAEPHVPYTRPGLTKQVLRGEKPESAALWRPDEFYAEHDVDLLVGSAATDLDTRAKRVRVAGRSLAYGSLVLATGADPRSLNMGDDVRDRVHTIRSLSDAQRIRPHLGAGTRWLVIGGGFIGAEFAASACLTGSDVALVMPEQRILEGPFGVVAAGWFDSRLRAQGVKVHSGTTVASTTLVDGAVSVTLKDGTTFVVDQIVVGIGVAPNTGLAQQAGLELAERGISVDRTLRTSAPGVFAVGDVAAVDSVLHERRIRIEHWDVARAHGVHVARQIAAGSTVDFTELPYFFGTMADWAFLEYVGTATTGGIARGSLDGDDLSIVYLDDNQRIVGVLTVKRPEDLAAARTLIADKARMDPATLINPQTPLEHCRAAQEATT